MDGFWGIFWLFFVLDGIVFAIICSFLAKEKGRDPGSWGFLGFFLGLLALLLLGFLPSSNGRKEAGEPDRATKKCPACAEYIKLEAVKCRFCGTEFDPDVVRQEVERHERELEERAKAARLRQEQQRHYGLGDACKVGNEESARRLLDAGGNPNSIDIDQRTPLEWAIQSGNLNLVKLLLDRGANPNYYNLYRSPLWHACVRGHRDMVKMLLERGARMTSGALCFWVCTELRGAARNGHLDVVRLLVEHGAKTGKDWPGSAYRAALANGHTDVADFLFEVIVVENARRSAAKARRTVGNWYRQEDAHSSGTAALPSPVAVQAEASEPASKQTDDIGYFTFVCPLCNARLRVRRRYAGATGKCNRCGGTITISL